MEKLSLYHRKLLEDCRNAMLIIPPKMFDKITSIVPSWRSVIMRLSDVLAKDKVERTVRRSTIRQITRKPSIKKEPK